LDAALVFNPESCLMNPNPDLQIYQAENGALEVRFDPQQDTVWLRQEQLSKLFGRERSVISKHLRRVFDEGELNEKSNVQILHIAHSDKPVRFYNLDVIISVGYRVKSKEATRFRQWATRTLREHLTQGFTTHQQRLRDNAQAFEAALALVRQATQSAELTSDMGRGLIDVVTRYAQSFLWLQQYDEGLLHEPAQQPGGTLPHADEARKSLAGLKADLIARGEATELFARERGDGLAALLGNLDQTVFGEPAYPSIESKAAHLLYFVIKNHPFADGNKRSGAFLFVDFLNRNHRLLDAEGQPVVNEMGLTALALLVAESAAEHKDTMIKLVMTMLASEPSSAPQEPNKP
jgi:prophage maintenance system killer protein/prophage antirepressor-like protein